MIRKLPAVLAALAVVVLGAPAAHAATPVLSMSAPTVRETTISYTCTTDTPGNLVARSWRYVNFTADSSHDDSAVVGAGGTVTQTRTLPASEQGLTYAARCLLYDPTTGALIVRYPASPTLIQVGYTVKVGSSDDPVGGETFAQGTARRVAEFNPDEWRIFWSGLPSTSCTDKKNSLAQPTVQSFKASPSAVAAGTYDATINAWLSCFTVPTTVTVWHEPEDDIAKGAYTAADYVAAENHLADLVAAHPNRANLTSASIWMDWTLDQRSGRDWHTYYASHVDKMLWDVYDFPGCPSGADTRFADHVLGTSPTTGRDFLKVAAETGKPWGVAEFGDPQTDACRPALLTQAGDFARAHGGRDLLYWDFATATNYELNDGPSQQAWAAVVTAS